MKKKVACLFLVFLFSFSFLQNVVIGVAAPADKLQMITFSTASRPLLLLFNSTAGVNNRIEV